MNITLEKVNSKDKEVIENLFQLFAYDFSELNGMDICDDGKYQGLNDIEDYYSKSNYCSYFVKVDGKLAGVAVLRFDEETNYFRHFFVMRKYRRMKVGLNSVHMIFKLHLGKWTVSPFDFNKPAISFWKNVFDIYTEGNYITQRRKDNKGPEFVFNL
jgi:predicted acetyltransferase